MGMEAEEQVENPCECTSVKKNGREDIANYRDSLGDLDLTLTELGHHEELLHERVHVAGAALVLEAHIAWTSERTSTEADYSEIKRQHTHTQR
jgi:hypothetical protein